jgi:hypothetical protein
MFQNNCPDVERGVVVFVLTLWTTAFEADETHECFQMSKRFWAFRFELNYRRNSSPDVRLFDSSTVIHPFNSLVVVHPLDSSLAVR